MLITESYGGPTHVVRGGTLPGPHDALPERRLIFNDGSVATVCGSSSCVGDFDGDGFEDLVGTYMDTDRAVLDAWILRGFAVPWEEDAWW
ncbi:MAG: FG-GAP repeat protein [Myxococcota bacterium]